ncbi:hypothetical protein [Amycolatopsis sp. NBC_01480]|uniref:hypothetical protein n=1 Tax=Amycolatopsis sp. NBC_01480 TaxID=2903562 RepID=UPI002E2AA385|nr:hypothetical protein [Amycolatopsis sp. NBC_01480]
MNKRLLRLWASGATPARDGLYRVDGPAWAVDVDGPALSWFEIGAPLDLNDVLADPEDVLDIDVSAEASLPRGGSVVCGEGAMGSEGFFARLDAMGSLVWVVSLLHSNPFYGVAVEESVATFTNNHGNSIDIRLDAPEFELIEL